MDIRIRILDKTELALVRDVASVVWPVTFREILPPEQLAYMMEMMYAPDVMAGHDEGTSHGGYGSPSATHWAMRFSSGHRQAP